MSAAKHAYVPTTCDTCHEAGSSFYVGSGTPLQTRPASHTSSPPIPTMATADCSACHDPTTWLDASPSLPAGHMPNPAAQVCSTCHTGNLTLTPVTNPLGYAQLASVAVLHTGITNGCAQCHGGSSALTFYNNNDNPLSAATLSPAHIPAFNGEDCSACHATNYTVGGFGPMNMTQATHSGVGSTCNSCHEAGLSFYMGAANPKLQGRPADHTTGQMAAPNDCSLCHTTANWNSNTLPAGHMPNPANSACTVCHTTAPADYSTATLAANSVLHTGIAGGCGTCHGGTTPLTWYNNFTPKDGVLTPSHIPYLSGTDCSSCHSSSTYAAGTFGPMNMTQAKHAFVPTSCNTCHEAGLSFYMGAASPSLQGRSADHTSGQMVAPNDCSLCHTTANWNSTVLPAGHMPNPANSACTVCHTTAPADYSTATLAANSVLHTGIAGGCGTCHGGTTPLTWYNNFTPKDGVLTPSHIPYLSGTDCSSCHSSSTYAAGTFGPMNMTQAKHAFVPSSCNTCHEAGLSLYMGSASPALQGRPADHTSAQMAAPNDCSGCHTTANWNSTLMPAGHMPNPGNQACATCHTGDLSTAAGYAQLAGISVLHTAITNNCQLCHGGPSGPLSFYNNNDNPKAAAGLTPPHIPYLNGSDCSVCHTSNYTAGGFGPATAMSAAKHAYVPTTCDTCHEAGSSFYVGSGTPLQTRPASHTSSPPIPTMATADCSACHDPTTWLDASPSLPAGHMPNPAAQVCSTCHTGNLTLTPVTNPLGYAQLASVAVLHTGITNGCAQCHGGSSALTFYNNNDNPLSAATLSPAHIPAFNGEDCSACHATNYTVGGFGPMNMTQATHSGVGSTCNSCHEAGLSFYMGAANPKLQGRPADHTTGQMAAPNDCSLCHTTANWNSNTLPAGHMPNPANSACTVCHTTAPADYSTATLAANSVLHTGIAGGCGTCHGGTTALTWYNNFTPKDGVLTPAHIPYLSGTDCSSCHASSTYAAGTFGPMNMTQAKHAFVSSTCVTCHEAGLSLYMGAASPALQGRPADHTSGQMVAPNDCSLCHTTANWNSTVLPTGHMPNPANSACTVCHTKAPSDYTTGTLAANATLHTGITSGCITCHGAPNASAPVFYLNYTPKDALLSPVHIPTASTPC